jgi:hypothetical protein
MEPLSRPAAEFLAAARDAAHRRVIEKQAGALFASIVRKRAIMGLLKDAAEKEGANLLGGFFKKTVPGVFKSLVGKGSRGGVATQAAKGLKPSLGSVAKPAIAAKPAVAATSATKAVAASPAATPAAKPAASPAAAGASAANPSVNPAAASPAASDAFRLDASKGRAGYGSYAAEGNPNAAPKGWTTHQDTSSGKATHMTRGDIEAQANQFGQQRYDAGLDSGRSEGWATGFGKGRDRGLQQGHREGFGVGGLTGGVGGLGLGIGGTLGIQGLMGGGEEDAQPAQAGIPAPKLAAYKKKIR